MRLLLLLGWSPPSYRDRVSSPFSCLLAREVGPHGTEEGQKGYDAPMEDKPVEDNLAGARGEDAAVAGEETAASGPGPSESGWVTTEVAAAALHVSPRTVRDYITSGDLEAKSEGEGVTK